MKELAHNHQEERRLRRDCLETLEQKYPRKRKRCPESLRCQREEGEPGGVTHGPSARPATLDQLSGGAGREDPAQGMGPSPRLAS